MASVPTGMPCSAEVGDTKQPAAWQREAHHGSENLCLGFCHSDDKKRVPWGVCIMGKLGREQDFPHANFFPETKKM